jgi:predicted dehydrogenase
MNELQFYSREDEDHIQGFREIIVNEGSHPYMDAWWPPGHIIGWEHTFVHEIKDFLEAVAKNRKVSPDFREGTKVQAVLEASSDSAKSGRWRKVPKV